MKLKHPFVKSFLVIMALFSFSIGQTIEQIRVGLVIDGPWGEDNEMISSIKREILNLTRGEFDVQFPKDKTILADWTIEKIKSSIDQLLMDSQVDLIITLGSISSSEICYRDDLLKPAIAPYVLDAGFQNFPIKNGTSGTQNLNYVSVPATFERDIKTFREIIPFKKAAVLINQYLPAAFPELEQRAVDLFREMDLEIFIVRIGHSVDEAINKLPSDVQAVYVLPLPHLSDADYIKLSQELIKRKLPSFSFAGAERVQQGLLAGLNKDVVNRISRRVALNVQRILLGEKPENIPVAISLDKQLTINDGTSRAIGVYPSWAILTEAELIGIEQRQIERKVDLYKVAEQAIAANLDLLAKEYMVTAGKQDVYQTRSKLLPAIDIAGDYVMIDKDRANGSLGQQAERTFTGSLTATQILFSEPLWANLSIQNKLQDIREFDRDQLRLDIIQASAKAYLNVLQAKTFEQIQKDNLKLTSHNLDIAKVREVVGSAGAAEVYRWESEIALNKNAVIKSNSLRNLAEMQLNRLLHRPVEEDFLTQEIDLNNPMLITAYGDIFKFIENRRTFGAFRNFMVQEALTNSPELASLDLAIRIEERILRSAKNSFWSPTLGLQGQISNIYSRDGAGTDGVSSPPGLPFDISGFFPEIKDRSWYVGLNLSFPIFAGGNKFVQKKK
jgi:outer membrane protein